MFAHKKVALFYSRTSHNARWRAQLSTAAVARENPRLPGVIDVTDFNATTAGQRIVDDNRLSNLIQVLNNPVYRLGLDGVEPDILGRAYEYLIRKFAEGQGQSAGEFYTPMENYSRPC
jgi:type I restriction enzyme M protein